MSDTPDAPSQHPWGNSLPPWFMKAVLYTLLAFSLMRLSVAFLAQLQNLLVMLLMALFMSFAMEPAVDMLAQRGWRRGPATGLVFAVTIIGGALFAWVIVDLMVSEASKLVNDAPGYVNDITHWINKRFHTELTTVNLTKRLRQYQGDLSRLAANMGGRVLSVSAQVVGGVFNFLTVLLFAFYLTADGPKLRRTICSTLPPDKQRLVVNLWELAIKKTGGYLYSRLLLALLSAIASGIAFSLFRVPYALALAVWTGLLSQFVPVVGTYMAGALPVLITLLNNRLAAVAVLIFLVLYQQVENYVFAPRITARTMDIHPAVAFGAVIAGSSVLGGIGALLSLPAAAIIQAFISSFVHRHEVIDVSAVGPSPLTGEMDLTEHDRSWINRVSRRLERQHTRPDPADAVDRPGWQGVEEDP